MINRFRNVVSNVMSGIPALPGVVSEQDETDYNVTSGRGRDSPLSPGKDKDGVGLRYAYGRPEFLQLNADEVQVSADHNARPILVPRDVTRIPWYAGYAEVINAGKTKLNEDQAYAGMFMVPYVDDEAEGPDISEGTPVDAQNGVSGGVHANSRPEGTRSPDSISSSEWQMLEKDPLPFTYFAIFDGHAGTGAALMAVKLLQEHIQMQLAKIRKLLICKRYNLEISDSRAGRNHCYDAITADDLVVGALETAFENMDDQIGEEKKHFKITGGCCVIVALFFLGKLYLANAGDSRAILCRGSEIIQMSHDFTPETERRRLMYLGQMNPETLHNEFSPLEFPRRVTRHDVSKQLLYRDALMHGWALKTISMEDTRFPLVNGRGKRSRVMATIGVTRGFGDHDLKVFDSNIHIKPFLSNRPQVEIYDLSEYDHSEDDVLIMGSDGLWDVTTNSKAAYIVKNCLSQFACDDRSRYTSAAQELVLNARGLLGKGWRTLDDRPASGDDITCYVIPLNRYGNIPSQSSSTESSFDTA